MTLKEWEKHVRTADSTDKSPKSVCGADVSRMDWMFVDEDHAAILMAEDYRMQPCRKCWRKLLEQKP